MKKIFELWFFLYGKKLRKTLRTMRLTVFILLLGILQMNATNVFPQGRLVNLEFEKISLEELLWEIQEQTDIVFVYGKEDIENVRDISVRVNNSEAIEVIKSCIKGTDVEMEIVDDVIVLRKKKESPKPAAQPSQTVAGKITGDDGNPLPGATVLVKGTYRGTTTNEEGNYSLEVPGENAVLVVSFIGFATQEVAVEGRSVVDVTMQEAVTSLDEVLIVSTGYQQLPKERLSGSFEVIDGKLFKDRPNADIATSLEGMVPGFQRVVKTNPDGSVYYDNRIRGQGTLTETIANPLLVVDGFPVEDADFSTINPNIVESVTILKDAAAASIWGARAANGVIVVTTKSGKGTEFFEVDANAFVRIGSKLDLGYINPIADTETHLAWEKYVYDNKLTGNLTPSALGEVLFSLSPSLSLYNEFNLGNISESEYNSQMAQLTQYNYQDDVYEYLLRKNIYQQFDVSVTGATERNNYSFSVLYDKTASHYVGDDSQKALINFKNNFKMNEWLRLDVGATIGLQDMTNEGASLRDIRSMPPYQRLVDENGNYVPMVKDYYLPILNEVSSNGNFPYDNWNYNLLQEIRSSDRQSQNNTVRLQAGLNVKFLEGLTWNGKIQYERVENSTKDIYSEESYLVRNQVNRYNGYDPATGNVTVYSGDGYAYPQGSALDRSSTQHESYVLRNQLQLDKDLGEQHHIMALVGSEVSSYVSNFNRQVRIWGYDDDKLLYANQPFYDDFGASQFYTPSKTRLSPGRNWESTYDDNRFFSLFGNLAYTYNRKYTLTGSVRTDASNMIVKDPKYRYAPFWSVGGRWSVNQEGFMANAGWIDRLQLRGSYGVLGNVVTSTSVVPLISYIANPNVNTQEYYARVQDFGNPLLRWEKTNTFNVGIDYAFFNNRLSGKVDLYSKQSEDVLADVDIAGAYGLGYSNAVNAAELLNRGIEVEIATLQNITPDLSWRGRLVVSRNKNEVTKLDVFSYYPARIVVESVFVEGRPISPVYSYIYEGEENGIPMIRFENDQKTEIFNIPTVSDARNFMQYEGSLIPTTELGFTSDFEYKGFALKAIATGRFGHVFRADAPRYPLLNSVASSVLGKPMEEVINGSPDKFPGLPPASVPDLSAYSIVRSFDTLVEDASNIRLKEVMLSYTLPQGMVQDWNISNIRLYSQVNNIGILWKATDTYYDPDFLRFKMPVSYLFGLNVTF
jgi:TonB-linked SusC/RagA family outer membrane protein